MPSWNFSGQVVVITGGAGGLGKSLIAQFLKAGAIVFASDYHRESIEKLKEIYRDEPNFHAKVVDITVLNQIETWVKEIATEAKRIDIVINAAGICPYDSIEQVTEELWNRVLDINLKGAFFVSQAVMHLMKEQQYGRIVQISSIAGHTGGAAVSAPYAASKAGIISIAKSFAKALAPYGVTVNAVAPGPFDTPMIADFPQDILDKMASTAAMGRVGKNEDVVNAVLFLCDPATSYITGSTIDINGGIYMR